MIELTYTESELEKVADDLLTEFRDENIWLFDGEMGAGKTTLIKAIGTRLEVIDEMSSPTFSIVNEYRTQGGDELFHFDFYRLEDPKEAINIGIEDYFFSGNKCFIEWPEVIAAFLPEKYLKISIKLVDDKTRHLTAIFNEPNL